MIWVCKEFHHLTKKNSNDNQSNIIDIQIQMPTKLAIPADEIAVNMASNTNIPPRKDIPRRRGIFSLFCIQKNINIHHLINAHNANIQIISFPTKLASLATIRANHKIIHKIPITKRNDIYGVPLF